MNNPLVSIIIPTYKRAHLIGETLDSVLAQTYENWECIIVDDGSVDHTDKIVLGYVNEDSRFQYHQRPTGQPKGANACRNYGFKLSKGEYVNWFDDDDVMHQDKLSRQIEALENSDYNFSVCQTLVFENSIDYVIGLRSENIYSDEIFYDYLTQKISWLTQAPLWKKKFLQSFDFLFDEALQAAQEWEFHCRVLSFCKDYNVIEEPLVYIRQHSESISYNGNSELRELHYYKAREKIYFLIKKINVPNNVRTYMGNYFLFHFKKFLIARNIKKAFFSLIRHIITNKEMRFTYKIKMIVVFFTFVIFNKGEVLFKGSRYKISKS
jgi:glycosyltransferase involved in cell wall biosynthesis